MYGPNRYVRIEDLPRRLPVFPLTGAIVLPRGHLPLNIFEPRYLAMVDAALKGERLIGMIQPSEHESKVQRPALMAVGCAGRLTGYRETDDGRYLITLTGICRFRIAREIEGGEPFRQVEPDFAPYLGDLVAPEDDRDFPRERLLSALRSFLAARDLKADFESMAGAPPEALVNALAMLCPFEPLEKQALLQAEGWPKRVETLIALLEMCGAAGGGSAVN